MSMPKRKKPRFMTAFFQCRKCGAITIPLPAAATIGNGFFCKIYKSDSSGIPCQACSRCNEFEWMPIETAPRNREIELRATIYHSQEHAKNTGIHQSEVTGRGRWLWGNHWSGILGGNLSHWKEGDNT